jgi:hypothetical protein
MPASRVVPPRRETKVHREAAVRSSRHRSRSGTVERTTGNLDLFMNRLRRRGVAAIEAGLRAMVLAKPGVEEASGVEAVQMTVITD